VLLKIPGHRRPQDNIKPFFPVCILELQKLIAQKGLAELKFASKRNFAQIEKEKILRDLKKLKG
jgi:hypothetical protein